MQATFLFKTPVTGLPMHPSDSFPAQFAGFSLTSSVKSFSYAWCHLLLILVLMVLSLFHSGLIFVHFWLEYLV
jgi:hypothetical protein